MQKSLPLANTDIIFKRSAFFRQPVHSRPLYYNSVTLITIT